MTKVNNKPLARNDLNVPHKVRMEMRKAERRTRVRVPYPLEYHFKTGKYVPAEEDKKRLEKKLEHEKKIQEGVLFP